MKIQLTLKALKIRDDQINNFSLKIYIKVISIHICVVWRSLKYILIYNIGDL